MTERIECRKVENEIDRLFAGELDEAEAAAVEAHVAECSECREAHAILARVASVRAPEPADEDLEAVRRRVLRAARRERPWWREAAVAAVAAILLASGWFAGRASGPETASAGRAAANPEIVLARQMQEVARSNDAFEDIENSPFRYANVEIDEEPDGRVRLAFDVSRHLEIIVPKSNPLVTEVLVQSMLAEGSVGAKLDAIGRASDVLDPRIRGALIKAMLHDANLGVRLQAQARLSGAPVDAGTIEAFLGVLESEESVQMRLVAIDYLARSGVAPERLEAAVEAGQPEGRSAVRVKARDYISTL